MRQRKRAQISLEIMYAVGTMIVMFLLLMGINFNRNIEIRDLQEYTIKLNECNQLAQMMNGIYTLGDNATSEYYTRQYAPFVDNTSLSITVSDEELTSRSVDAACTFLAPIAKQYLLEPLTTYTITNRRGVVYLEA